MSFIDERMIYDENGKRLSNKIGVLSDLQTQNKDSLVGAVNEHAAQLAEKADKTYVDTYYSTLDTKINSQASGSPKGVYSTLTDLQTAFPTGNNNIYLVTTDGKWYYWNGSAWTAGGVYHSTAISKGSVTPDKVSFLTTGKNLFNKDTVTAGKFVQGNPNDPQKGQLVDNASYCASDYISVTGGQTYYLTNISTAHYAFYDAAKNFITGDQGTGNTITAPANADYLRVSIDNVAKLETAQLEIGTVGTAYESFRYNINYLKVNGLTGDDLADKSVKAAKTDFINKSKNLFNKGVITTGYYVNSSNGALTASSNYNASDFIEITPSTDYFVSYGHQIAFYDSAKTYISGVNLTTNGASGGTFTTPSTAKYIRVTVPNDKVSSYQLEIGNVGTDYEPYGYSIPYLDLSSTKDDFLLFLPSEICIAVGRTIELYNKQVCWTGNIDNYHFQWICNVGKAMNRKWSCTATSDKIGNYVLTCNVYDNNMNLIAQATTTVKIVNFSVASAKKILPIGDSLTNGKGWLAELRKLSGDKYSFVGTRWNGDVQGGYLNHEGRSGATAAWYLANSTYTFETNGVGSNNPFWNPSTSQFDFGYYKSTYSINPDVVQIFLGTNGITLDPTDNVNNIKAIVDGIRANDNSIQIYVVFTLYRGDQNGIGKQEDTDGYTSAKGSWKLEEDRKVYNLMTALYDALKSYTNLYFIPISLTHDSEYNFKGLTPVPVNPRSTLTEYQDTEATHPSASDAGYNQMADIMFSTYAAHIS